MRRYELAQLNIAKMIAPLESPELADFVSSLDSINALAERSTGFVWRLQSEDGDATSFRPFGDDMLVNLTVWKNVRSLHNYVYQSGHVDIMRRRKEWFSKIQEAYVVLWWVAQGHIPTIEEAGEKLKLLQADGPGPEAFTFKSAFPAPGDVEEKGAESFDDLCPAT